MVCMGFAPGASGWKAQMKLRSYGGPLFKWIQFFTFCTKMMKIMFCLANMIGIRTWGRRMEGTNETTLL